MRLYLTGFMGSGKTTVGRLLSGKLRWAFYDLDQEIERTTGKTVQQIFEQDGEAFFRDQERQRLERLLKDPSIVATGGGCFIYNRDWMLQHGTVVFLDVPFESLVRRVGGDPSRPLWQNAERLYAERREHYRKAHFTVRATGDSESVAQEVLISAGLQDIKK